MATTLLRFRDLQSNGVATSWPQLRRLQQLHGFPLGRMLSPNCRVWTAEEVDEWIASRPRANTAPLKGGVKAKHARKLAASWSAAAAPDPSKPTRHTAARDESVEPAE